MLLRRSKRSVVQNQGITLNESFSFQFLLKDARAHTVKMRLVYRAMFGFFFRIRSKEIFLLKYGIRELKASLSVK